MQFETKIILAWFLGMAMVVIALRAFAEDYPFTELELPQAEGCANAAAWASDPAYHEFGQAAYDRWCGSESAVSGKER
jgi:hypothetical protein